jgi:pyruvate dehydrogenase E2 component (dihydrolipoamide acetyltransferase)
MRGAIARRLVESKTQLPHFYVEVEIDAAPLLAVREQLNTGLEDQGVKLSVNDFILKASAEALRRVPQVNGSWQGDRIQYFAAAHVAFAVAIEDGLITPVIKRCAPEVGVRRSAPKRSRSASWPRKRSSSPINSPAARSACRISA